MVNLYGIEYLIAYKQNKKPMENKTRNNGKKIENESEAVNETKPFLPLQSTMTKRSYRFGSKANFVTLHMIIESLL